MNYRCEKADRKSTESIVVRGGDNIKVILLQDMVLWIAIFCIRYWTFMVYKYERKS
jgi:hypothetical protein